MQRFFLFIFRFLGFLFGDCIRDSSNGEGSGFADKDGVSCTYDSLNRLVLKKSGLFEESWEYDGEFLKSYKDPSGLVTNYEYDEFSRKISEDCGGRKKEFLYDKMGYLS
jgi:YD repeat-containing protein